MTAEEIKNIVRCGETSSVQFKLLFKTAEDIANELVAFSNGNGGRIFIGVNGALQSDADIEFFNEVSGDQFRVVLWRKEETTLKDCETTQKATLKGGDSEETTQKTTLKGGNSEETTQKTTLKGGNSEETTQKTTQTTTQKIIELLSLNPQISTEELARLCQVTRDGINWQIRKLKQKGLLRRVGPDNGGYWEVL